MKIAVLGSAPSSRALAPFNDPSWEIWSCSPQNYDLPRVDAWFELHNLDRKFVPENKVYTDMLQKHPRVYVAHADVRLPDATVLDPKPLLQRFGRYFFSSSPAWMLGMALMQNPTEIGLWGIDMSASDEYDYQRPGIHYFMHEAAKSGVKVIVPMQSDIGIPHPLYGFKEFWPSYWKKRVHRQELMEKLTRANQKEAKSREEKIALQGALSQMQYEQNTWLHPEAPDDAF